MILDTREIKDILLRFTVSL